MIAQTPIATRFSHSSRARSWTTLLVLCAIYAGLIWAIQTIDMAPWLAALITTFTLPALLEFAQNQRASLVLDAHSIQWTTHKYDDGAPLTMIRLVQFHTRLDLSVRITLILNDGRKIRLPHACTPPHRAFETALKSQGVKTQRNHFAFF